MPAGDGSRWIAASLTQRASLKRERDEMIETKQKSEHRKWVDRYRELLSGAEDNNSFRELIGRVRAIIDEHHGDDHGPFAGIYAELADAARPEMERLAINLESLPVRHSDKTPDPLYFWLSPDGEWVPAYNAEIKPGAPYWAMVGIHEDDGVTSCAMAERLPQWAHCTMDGKPSLPWSIEDVEEMTNC